MVNSGEIDGRGVQKWGYCINIKTCMLSNGVWGNEYQAVLGRRRTMGKSVLCRGGTHL